MYKSLGDRIKANYELRGRRYLVRRMPVIIRVDGKAFHTYTKGMNSPFDQKLINCMVHAAQVCASNMQGFKAGYIQSDEASFLITDYDNLQTDAWFGYCQNKIESISASTMTAAFNKVMNIEKDAYFDARSFNVPAEEVSNYFLWRMLDWNRNSLEMYSRSFFSAKQLHKKNRDHKHEMLHQIGKNWTTDLGQQIKNGTWIFKDGSSRFDILPQYTEIYHLLKDLLEPQENVL